MNVGESDPNLVCQRCGAYGAKPFCGELLCDACYSGAGSCCPEFGADDLWEGRLDELTRNNNQSPSSPPHKAADA
jgi:hypothetical protein